MEKSQIIIVGGGLAGLTAAIHLSKLKMKVTVIEKNEFPKHKVCGEYISNEVLPYLEWLDIEISDLKPTRLTEFQFSTTNGLTIFSSLPLGGFGISRYELDQFLYHKALSNGCLVMKDSVEEVVFHNDTFTVTTSNDVILKADFVLGAFGKRSNIDVKLNRNHIQKKSPWLAVKGHYSGEFPSNLVGLHNFKGGYCGVSKVENEIINICYLVEYGAFQEHKSIADFQKEVVNQNPYLKEIFEHSTPLFEKPLTISQISFEKKSPVEQHILLIGDAAGLIHPLCGNGMAMAIHSAKLACDSLLNFENSMNTTRVEVERNYSKKWSKEFGFRMKVGRTLATILLNSRRSELLLRALIKSPFLLRSIIKMTHGKPITI
jgi:flavin-dependent dehydrogenase